MNLLSLLAFTLFYQIIYSQYGQNNVNDPNWQTQDDGSLSQPNFPDQPNNQLPHTLSNHDASSNDYANNFASRNPTQPNRQGNPPNRNGKNGRSQNFENNNDYPNYRVASRPPVNMNGNDFPYNPPLDDDFDNTDNQAKGNPGQGYPENNNPRPVGSGNPSTQNPKKPNLDNSLPSNNGNNYFPPVIQSTPPSKNGPSINPLPVQSPNNNNRDPSQPKISINVDVSQALEVHTNTISGCPYLLNGKNSRLCSKRQRAGNRGCCGIQAKRSEIDENDEDDENDVSEEQKEKEFLVLVLDKELYSEFAEKFKYIIQNSTNTTDFFKSYNCTNDSNSIIYRCKVPY